MGIKNFKGTLAHYGYKEGVHRVPQDDPYYGPDCHWYVVTSHSTYGASTQDEADKHYTKVKGQRTFDESAVQPIHVWREAVDREKFRDVLDAAMTRCLNRMDDGESIDDAIEAVADDYDGSKEFKVKLKKYLQGTSFERLVEAATTWKEDGVTVGKCENCGDRCTDHPDANDPIAWCADCGAVTCSCCTKYSLNAPFCAKCQKNSNNADRIWEDAAANAAGGGGVAGLGVGPKGEPGVNLKKRKKPEEVESLEEGWLVWWSGTVADMRAKGWKVKWRNDRIPSDSTKVRIVSRDDGEEDDDAGPEYVETDDDMPRTLGQMLKEDHDTFAGARVFEVDMDRLMKSRMGKHPRHRYSRYVGEDDRGEEIRQHGRDRKSGDIILKDAATSVMMYLRRRNRKS